MSTASEFAAARERSHAERLTVWFERRNALMRRIHDSVPAALRTDMIERDFDRLVVEYFELMSEPLRHMMERQIEALASLAPPYVVTTVKAPETKP